MGVDLSAADPPAADPPVEPMPAPDTPRRKLRWCPDPGAVLAWASVGPALAVAGWLLVAYPLALAGRATPPVTLPAAVVVVGLLLVAARRLPSVPHTPWWSVLATVGTAAGFALFTATHASGHVVLRRDAAVYALLARWIADSGRLAVPAHLDAIGGGHPSIAVGAPGLYPVGDTLSTQFMSGTALTLAPAGWGGGGWGLVLTAPAVLGGFALLSVAGLAARLIGPRWAAVAAAAVGLSQPVLLTDRSTYSETLAQLLLLAAMCLLVDVVAGRGRALSALVGLLVGLGLLVRIDALRDIALLVPVVAWLAFRGHPTWPPLAAGLALGGAYGAVDALGPTRPYVSDQWESVRPALLAFAALTALAVLTVPLARLVVPWLAGGRWRGPARTVAATVAAAGIAGILGWLALRPYVWTGRGTTDASRLIESLQREQGLPVDGGRTYDEQAVRWVSWFVGWPALALAAVAAVVVTWRAVRGDPAARRLAAGLAVPLASAVTVLWYPGITPDHPWADRRLVPTVLPVVVLLALVGVAAIVAATRRAGGAWGRPAAAALVVAGVLAVLVPVEAGSRPLRDSRTEVGEPVAVDQACSGFASGDVALLVDARSRQEWTAPLREVCDVPAFGIPGIATDRTATRAEVDAAADRVRSAGLRPILVAQSGTPLPRLTSQPQRQLVKLTTFEHQRLLVSSPHALAPLTIELWIAAPERAD